MHLVHFQGNFNVFLSNRVLLQVTHLVSLVSAQGQLQIYQSRTGIDCKINVFLIKIVQLKLKQISLIDFIQFQHYFIIGNKRNSKKKMHSQSIKIFIFFLNFFFCLRLGNRNIHELTNNGYTYFRIEMMDHDSVWKYAEYSTFNVESGNFKYRLHVNGYSGNAGN